MSQGKPKKGIINSTIAGAGAGCIEVLCMQPTDVLKTRFQSARIASNYQSGVTKAFSRVVNQEGIPALWRGTVPTLWIVIPRVSLQYFGLAAFKPIFERLEGRLIPAHSSAGLAGICTGIFQATTLVTPLEMIKVRQQTDIGRARYHSMWMTTRSVVQEEGFFALYKGLLPTVVRQSWGLVVKFTGYTEIKALFESASPDPTKPLAPWQHMTAGGLANVLVGILNSPPDVVKTRMQDAGAGYTTTWDCCKKMWLSEGFRSFFRGAWLRVLRIAPGGAIQFAAYEQISHALDSRAQKVGNQV